MSAALATRPRSPRGRRIAATAGLLVVAGGAMVATAAASSAGSSTVPTVPITAVPQPTTTTPSTFVSAEDASAAARSVFAAYAERTLNATVSDPACSLPASGAEGEQFVCYATKAGPLLVSMRVTIGPNRELTITPEVDQQPAPPPVAVIPTTTAAG